MKRSTGVPLLLSRLFSVSRENTELRLAVDYISKKIAAPLALWSNSPAALYIGGMGAQKDAFSLLKALCAVLYYH